jgi:hypothetical protein
MNSKFPTNHPRFYNYIFTHHHMFGNYQIWLLLFLYAMCTRVKLIITHLSLNINFQQFPNSNVTAILLCLFDVASSIVTLSITLIFFANSIVTSSITSILRYLLLWTLDARCFRKYRFSDTLSYYLKYFLYILLFCYYLPLEKGATIHLNKPEFPPPKNNLYQVLLKLAQWFWRRSRKCKSLQTDRRTTDNRLS